MKQLFLRKGRSLLFFGFLLLSIIACQEDNDLEIPDDSGIPLTQNVTTHVTANDIPEIMGFVSRKADAQGYFTIKAEPGTREADLTGVTVDSLDILVNTNDADLSNYSFKMEPDEGIIEGVALNLVVKETSTGLYGYIVKYRPDAAWLDSQVDILDWNDFTGDILFYRLDGTYAGKETFVSNSATTRELVECPDDTNSGGGGGGGPLGEDDGDPGGGGGSCDVTVVVVPCPCQGHLPGQDCACTPQPTIEIVMNCPDRTAQENIERILRTPCPPPECFETNGDPCTCAADGVSCDTGGNGNNGNNGNTEENEEVGVNVDTDLIAGIIENRIVSTNLDPCSSQILTDLKTLTQNDIANIITRFDTPSNIYDWEIETSTPSVPGNAAETDRRNGSVPFDYVTKLGPNYTSQATKTAIARTILHEMLHAYMISHIDDVNAGNSVDIRNFAQLWQFIRNSTSPGGSTQPAQHEYMAQRFIPHIKDALKEWDNAQQSDQYYEDLAWGALFNTGTFNHFHPVGSPSRDRIINTNLAEDTNSNQGGVNPKGNPC